MCPQDAANSAATCPSGLSFREVEWSVDISDPVLRDHFPASPIVPAFMQLEAVRIASEPLFGGSPAEVRFRSAKFLAPLLPGQPVLISLVRSSDGRVVSFSIKAGSILITKGEVLAT